MEACELSEQSIKRIENRKVSRIDAAELYDIAQFFDVDITFILGKQKEERREISDTASVTGLSYDAVAVLRSIDHLENINLFHALSAFICSPSFVPLMVQIANFCTPNNDSVPGWGFSYSDVTNAAVQKYTAQCLEEAKKQCEKKMEWFRQVLPPISAIAGKLAEQEKEEGQRYSRDRIIKEVTKQIGLDADGEKLFFDLLENYRRKGE